MSEAVEEDILNPGGRDDADDEGLFGRDPNGQLVRRDDPTKDDYDTKLTIYIDGKPVTVRKAARQKDAQGNIIYKLDGSTVPRYTTIYDATVRQLRDSGASNDDNPIPVICHQQHMQPVAVCRMCTVLCGKEITEDVKKPGPDGTEIVEKKTKLKMERRLTPACQRPVEKGMHVFTMNAKPIEGYVAPKEQVERAAKEVRQAVEVVHELLKTDHLKPAPEHAKELNEYNELATLEKHYGLSSKHFSLLPEYARADATEVAAKAALASPHRPLDNSSPVFQVDHSACILCDRCVRACDEVKKNNVISRTGKGRTAGISFDLDDPMGDSSCVQCGECMVSCPTTAITFKKVAKINLQADNHKSRSLFDLLSGKSSKHKSRFEGSEVQAMPALELAKDKQFSGVPFKFLLWQEGLVLRRRVKAGEALCLQGEAGNSAFLIRSGTLEVVVRPKDKPEIRDPRDVRDYVLGEMACLSGTPRTADVIAKTDCEVLEVRRNVLDRIMRSPEEREKFQKIYRDRALSVVLRTSDLFKGLSEDEYKKLIEFMKPRLTFVRCDPEQPIFKQDEFADCMYLVRLGHVRIAIGGKAREGSLLFRGPGTVIGEIGLLAIDPDDIPRDEAAAEAMIKKLDKALGDALNVPDSELPMALPSGKRTASCSALDHLEMARISRADFLLMVKLFPAVRYKLVEMAVRRLRGETVAGLSNDFAMRDFVEQGLYQGQSLLVLDLEKCTRCDECVRACIDQHGTESHGMPITRLIRDGLRFGEFMVATSCRSCKDAYCMIGCPVDSIHRGKHLQIVIESHCIGCGLCASNCPYGNISMLPNQKDKMERDDADSPGGKHMVARRKAAVCDLCDADGELETPVPRCVYACPHDAAHRMNGDELKRTVIETSKNAAGTQ